MSIAAVKRPPDVFAEEILGLLRAPRPLLLQQAKMNDEAAAQAADLESVRACLGGNGEAYRQLVERHERQVATIMWRFSRDPETHEELVQDVFVEAYTSLSTYKARAPFAHWLSRVATRVGYRFWKRRDRERERRTVSLEDWMLPRETPADNMLPNEAAETLHRLLGELPPRDRLALTLRYIEDLSVEETAQRTSWSRAMVKVQCWRARKKLKQLFERAEREEG